MSTPKSVPARSASHAVAKWESRQPSQAAGFSEDATRSEGPVTGLAQAECCRRRSKPKPTSAAPSMLSEAGSGVVGGVTGDAATTEISS